MERESGRCPHCAGWLGISRIEEIVFLYCRDCGYFELDRGEDSFSGYADSFRVKRLRLLLATEIPDSHHVVEDRDLVRTKE